MTRAYVVSMYEEGRRRPSDCLGDFYESREAGAAAGAEEVARVAAIPRPDRHRTTDWAVRFTVRGVNLG